MLIAEQSVLLVKRSRRARSLAAYFLFARVRILADSRRMMYHALRDTKRSSNAWRLRFIVSLCDTICCGAFCVIGNSDGISYYTKTKGSCMLSSCSCLFIILIFLNLSYLLIKAVNFLCDLIESYTQQSARLSRKGHASADQTIPHSEIKLGIIIVHILP